MLHLFNKVYLDFDDNIEINFDRVVISKQNGNQMYQALDKVAQGELHGCAKTYEEIVGTDFVGFLASLRDSSASGKKLILFCDVEAYKKVLGSFFKLILPKLDLNSFKELVKFNMYNQRIISNTNLAQVTGTTIDGVWSDFDVQQLWETTPDISAGSRSIFKNLNVNYSYEFLLASYLNDGSYKDTFKKTFHMFLRRWWSEMFSDNRQMILLNISNHKLMSHLGIDTSIIDITAADPIANVPQLQSYSDNKIWIRKEDKYGVCKLEGLGVKKADKLLKTLQNVFSYEGIAVDLNQFGEGKGFLRTACAKEVDETIMGELLDYVVANPFDTCLIPRQDFENVNFPLLQHFLKLKHEGTDLSKYTLL